MSVFEIIKQVLLSWQVIVAVIVVVAYIHIVSYVAKSYHRPRSFKKIDLSRFKRTKKEKPAADTGGPEETFSGGDSNDELGLEEA
ncbi:MAG: hypothetical protein FWD22_01790 [Treponema sp.]|nr:hypothetical protein [Treponema sp.]